MLSHVKARGERKGNQSLETRNGKGIMERKVKGHQNTER